ncbi:hypothetical protein EDB92DRAFT_1508014 [Lactarius akahatsu]|uniref:Uncharacterized protein n=1 Tax=Lactarius akahatsu TaxID=416441 RepID=A0AAD4QAJ9_9AGAM|nr:hypothetical protein EDB92DRAFT_1508014 [Lactarius akahatsu]
MTSVGQPSRWVQLILKENIRKSETQLERTTPLPSIRILGSSDARHYKERSVVLTPYSLSSSMDEHALGSGYISSSSYARRKAQAPTLRYHSSTQPHPQPSQGDLGGPLHSEYSQIRARLGHPLPVHRTGMYTHPEAKTPIKHLQKEMEGHKTLLDTINALIAVGAFIAGVQAQLISVTYGSNDNALGKATNWFGFVGLTLDLIGTSASVVRALLLQQTIRRSHRLVVRLPGQIDGARHEMREQQERHAADALGYRPCPPSRGNWGVHPFRERIRGILPNINVEGIGRVPVVSLAGGGLFLLVSMVLFAGASQPHAVWVSCASIAMGTLFWSIIPTTNPRKRSRAALYEYIEETSEHYPPVNPPVFPVPQRSNSGT